MSPLKWIILKSCIYGTEEEGTTFIPKRHHTILEDVAPKNPFEKRPKFRRQLVLGSAYKLKMY